MKRTQKQIDLIDVMIDEMLAQDEWTSGQVEIFSRICMAKSRLVEALYRLDIIDVGCCCDE